MPDIIQVAEQLKDMPDQWLAQQMQNPSGTAPPWLVASEVARREKLRSGASQAQAPQSSVSQDLIKSLYARIPPTAGLMPQAPQPPGMPPVNLSPGSNPSTLGAGGAPGSTPPGNFKMPARMAGGGSVDDSDDEDDPYDIYNRQPSRRSQMDQLMGQVNDAALGAGATERNIIGSIVPKQVSDPVQGLAQTERNVAGDIGSDYLNAGRVGARDVGNAVGAVANTAGQVNNALMGTAQTGRNVAGAVLDRLRNNASAPQQAPIPQQVPQQAPQQPQQPPQQAPAQPSPASPPDPLARLVEEAAQRYELPAEMLKAVIGRESSWNPQAIGPVTKGGEHALGLMQVLPSTAAGDFGVTDPNQLFDPAVNIDTGARYLKKLLVQYNGDTNMALMAYNMGPGALARNGGRPYQSTDAYVRNINNDINAERKKINLPPIDDSQAPNARSRLLDQVNRQAENASNMPVPADPLDRTDIAPMAAPVTPGAPATKATVARQDPLHQTWTPSAISPMAAEIQKQIDAKQNAHVPVEDRLRALLGQDNLDLLNNAGRSIFGPPPDYSKYNNAISQVMAMAQKQMNPSIGQGLIDWGLAMMANPSHNFGVAMGQSGAYAMQKYQTMHQQGMKDFLEATKAGMELQDKENQYAEKIGQYKMQRLGAQQAGVTADERGDQADLNALYRQKNTAQINYEKTLTTPDAVNNMAMAIMNRERIPYDPKAGDPIDQLVATGNKAWVDEAYLSSKLGTGSRGSSSVGDTQEARARSLLTMKRDPWEPDLNPDDAQYSTARAKVDKKYPELAGLYTTAAGANLPEQAKEAEDIADGIMAGRVDPSMTGMYGKQVLVKSILESKYHYDLAQAQQQWNAVKAFTASMNNAQQIKYRTDINFVANQIPLVQNAYDKWKQTLAAEVPDYATRFKGFNKAALEASLSLGGQAGAVARTLVGHIAELQSALPGVYSGGYAPHNEDLERVKLMIDGSWDDPSFAAGMKVVGDTILARKNAVNLNMPFGVSPASPYTKNLPGSKAPGATGATPQMGGGQQQYRNLHQKGNITIGVGADGKWHNVATGELWQ